MKKIIKLTESDLEKIIRGVIKEQIKQGGSDDPWEYKKDGENYYTRKKGSPNWALTSGKAKESIKSKIFGVNTSKPTSLNSKSDQSNKYKVDLGTGIQTNKSDTFSPLSRDTLYAKYKPMIESFQEAVKLIGNVTKRTYNTLISFQQKNDSTLKSVSFIIINKDSAIASLFGPNYKFIINSSITTGMQTDDEYESVESEEDWIRLSLEWFLKSVNKNSTEHSKIRKWLLTHNISPNQDINTLSDQVYNENKKYLTIKEKFPPSYEALKYFKRQVTPSGVFKLGTGYKNPGYVGAPDIINTFPLVTLNTGKSMPSAIHAYAGKHRVDLAKKASKEDIEKVKDYTRAGAGCTNVSRDFLIKISEYNPEYVIILPDKGRELLAPKLISTKDWTEKMMELGQKCVASLYDFFGK